MAKNKKHNDATRISFDEFLSVSLYKLGDFEVTWSDPKDGRDGFLVTVYEDHGHHWFVCSSDRTWAFAHRCLTTKEYESTLRHMLLAYQRGIREVKEVE